MESKMICPRFQVRDYRLVTMGLKRSKSDPTPDFFKFIGDPVSGGLNFEEFIKIFDEARETAPKYTESILKESFVRLEESKILEETGEIIKIITKDALCDFLTSFGDTLNDDDMKDFFSEFDLTGQGMCLLTVYHDSYDIIYYYR